LPNNTSLLTVVCTTTQQRRLQQKAIALVATDAIVSCHMSSTHVPHWTIQFKSCHVGCKPTRGRSDGNCCKQLRPATAGRSMSQPYQQHADADAAAAMLVLQAATANAAASARNAHAKRSNVWLPRGLLRSGLPCLLVARSSGNFLAVFGGSRPCSP